MLTGMAVSQSNEQVLRQIEVTIKRYERENLAERSAEHGEHSEEGIISSSISLARSSTSNRC